MHCNARNDGRINMKSHQVPLGEALRVIQETSHLVSPRDLPSHKCSGTVTSLQHTGNPLAAIQAEDQVLE